MQRAESNGIEQSSPSKLETVVIWKVCVMSILCSQFQGMIRFHRSQTQKPMPRLHSFSYFAYQKPRGLIGTFLTRVPQEKA